MRGFESYLNKAAYHMTAATSAAADDLLYVFPTNAAFTPGKSITVGHLRNSLNPTIGQRLLGNINNVWMRHWKEQLTTGKTQFTLTYNTITKAPCPDFNYVRAILKCGEAIPPTAVGLLLAVTASNTDLTVPTTGNTLTGDGATGWVQATFAGANTPTLVAGTSSLPTVLYTDWMPLSSIAPTDGTTLPYIMGRMKYSANYSGLFTGVDNTNNTLDSYVQVTGAVGDFITTPEGLTSNATQNSSPIFGFEFKSSKPVVKIVCVGSSTTQGNGTTPVDSLFASWVPLSQTLLTAAGVPVNMINYGYNSQTSATYAAFGKMAIAVHQPSVGFYPPFSTNDGTPTQAIIDTQFARAMDFAEYAMAQNCLPVFTFLCPNDTYTLTQDNFRKSLITRCKASGFAVLDMTPAVGDGASPERFIPAMAFDTVHANDAGNAAQAALCNTFVQTLLSTNLSF